MRRLAIDEKITIRGYIFRVYGQILTKGQFPAVLKLNDAALVRFFGLLSGKSCLYAFTGSKKLNRTFSRRAVA